MARDRHGRTRRADGDPRRRPPDGFRVRDARRFQRIAGEAVSSLPGRLRAPLAGARIRVVDAPPPRADDEARLATFDGDTLTLYRRAIEMRADDRLTLEETLRVAIARAVARRLGYGDDIDDLLG